MLLQCPKCKKQYNVDSGRITETGVKITCPACKHQFVARKKQDEKATSGVKPAKAGGDKATKRKTPPCAVCGEPSTHVFMGPPPRPLCEIHFKVEKEKGTRFFEPENAKQESSWDSANAEMASGHDSSAAVEFDFDDKIELGGPSATRVASPSSAPAPKPAVPKKDEPKKSAPATVSEPTFESFDDDFDFMDGAAGETPLPRSVSPPDEGGGSGIDEDTFISSPHEFLESGGGLSREEVEAREAEDPFRSETVDKPLDEASASPRPPRGSSAPEDSEPDFIDPFKPEPSLPSEPSPPAGKPDKDRFMSGDLNAEGGEKPGADSDFPDFEMPEVGDSRGQAEEDFEWAKTDGLELQDSSPSALSAAAAAPAPMPEKSPFTSLTAITPRKPKNAGTALAILIVFAAVFSGSAYFSLSGLAESLSPPAGAITLPPLMVEASLALDVTGDAASMSVAPLPVPAKRGVSGKAGFADPAAQAATALMWKDTTGDYTLALTEMEKALAANPADPELIAQKAHILAFAESLGAGGEIQLEATDSKTFLDSVDSGLKGSPYLLKAQAHSLLNEGKPAAARSILDDFMKIHPNDALAIGLAGMTYLYQQNPDLGLAEKYLEQAISRQPDFVRAYWELAKVYRAQGKHDKAISVYKAILPRSPEREGVTDAIEAAAREQSAAPTNTLIDLPPPVAVEVPPIVKTGGRISEDLSEIIVEVAPMLKKFQPQPTTIPRPYSGRPRPPEEAR